MAMFDSKVSVADYGDLFQAPNSISDEIDDLNLSNCKAIMFEQQA